MHADKHVLAAGTESDPKEKPQIRRGKLMLLHRNIKLSTRLRLAKLESAILTPGLAVFIGLGILGLAWQQGGTGFDIAPPVWILIQLWWALMAGSFVVTTYRNGDNDAGILKDLLEDDLRVGELRDEDLALQIRLAVGYRTALEASLLSGGREDPHMSLIRWRALMTGCPVWVGSRGASTTSGPKRLSRRGRSSTSGSASSISIYAPPKRPTRS